MTTGQIALDVLISLIPPFLMGILFWLMMRSILRADSRERDTYAKIEAEERAKRANALGEQP
jgi:flagellar biosynthesis/type III secretory pathway M-ring protein FliF/YscJ